MPIFNIFKNKKNKDKEEIKIEIIKDELEINIESFISKITFAEDMIEKNFKDFDIEEFKGKIKEEYSTYLTNKDFIQKVLKENFNSYKYIPLDYVYENNFDCLKKTMIKIYGITYVLNSQEYEEKKEEIFKHLIDNYKDTKSVFLFGKHLIDYRNYIIKNKSNNKSLMKMIIWYQTDLVEQKHNSKIKEYLNNKNFILDVFKQGFNYDFETMKINKISLLIKDSFIKDEDFVKNAKNISKEYNYPYLSQFIDEKLKTI